VQITARISGAGLPALTTPAGKKITKLVAGRYTLVVSDTSNKHSFHLSGPGVNKTTGIRAEGKFTWKLTFRRGIYTYRDDAKPKVKRTVKVTARPPV